jgi:plasmid stability protein
MADVLIRGVDDETLERLKKRAELAGRSLQSETKLILERAAGRTLGESLVVAAAWRKKRGKSTTDSVKALRQDRRR